jgi:hypothetical protein
MTRGQLAILIAASVGDAVRALQLELDALKTRLSTVNAGIEIEQLRAAAIAAREQGNTLH